MGRARQASKHSRAQLHCRFINNENCLDVEIQLSFATDAGAAMLVTLVSNSTGRRSTWRVIDKRSAVAFSGCAGPWLLLVPAGRPPSDRAARWVHALLDQDFKVMPGRG